jgi:hypothetical protein
VWIADWRERKFQLSCVDHGRWCVLNHVEFLERGQRGHVFVCHVAQDSFVILRTMIVTVALVVIQGAR